MCLNQQTELDLPLKLTYMNMKHLNHKYHKDKPSMLIHKLESNIQMGQHLMIQFEMGITLQYLSNNR